jgi:hypothetical protein
MDVFDEKRIIPLCLLGVKCGEDGFETKIRVKAGVSEDISSNFFSVGSGGIYDIYGRRDTSIMSGNSCNQRKIGGTSQAIFQRNDQKMVR